jgi:hypothetical protein
MHRDGELAAAVAQLRLLHQASVVSVLANVHSSLPFASESQCWLSIQAAAAMGVAESGELVGKFEAGAAGIKTFAPKSYGS